MAPAMRSRRGDAGGAERTDRSPRRLFADDAGVLWTAELRRPRAAAGGGETAAPLILFWSETRACLATLRGGAAITELTEEDLRRHLRACLSS